MDRRHFLGSATVLPLAMAGASSQAALPKGEPWQWTASELAHAIRTRKLSAREAVESTLSRLAAVNPKINAVVADMADEAVRAAEAADRHKGAKGILHGVPVTIKINTDQKGYATTHGASHLKSNIAPDDASVVSNFRNSGAIIIGRTNCPTFSFRWFTDCDAHGRTLNPHDRGLTPGGSSGGGSAAVAAGIGPIGHGSDLGGSVRYPAYACGVFGLRPTVGRVPRFQPTAARAPASLVGQLFSVDGLFARSVEDLRLSLAAIARGDRRDPLWNPQPLAVRPSKTSRAAIMTMGVKGSGLASLMTAAKQLEAAGYAVEEASLPHYEEAAELWGRIVLNESRIGLLPSIRKSGDKAAIFAADAMLDLAPAIDLQGYLDCFSRRLFIQRAWSEFFEKFPIVLMPVSLEPPFPVDLDQTREGMSRIFAAQKPLFGPVLAGVPGLAVPTGMEDGVPSGVQIVADRFREDLCFQAAGAIAGVRSVVSPAW